LMEMWICRQPGDDAGARNAPASRINPTTRNGAPTSQPAAQAAHRKDRDQQQETRRRQHASNSTNRANCSLSAAQPARQRLVSESDNCSSGSIRSGTSPALWNIGLDEADQGESMRFRRCTNGGIPLCAHNELQCAERRRRRDLNDPLNGAPARFAHHRSLNSIVRCSSQPGRSVSGSEERVDDSMRLPAEPVRGPVLQQNFQSLSESD